MNTRLVVDSSSQLQELKDRSPLLRFGGKLISIIFHPVFVPVYIVWFLLYVHPTVFVTSSGSGKKWIVLLQALLMYSFFPLVTVLLLRALKFINSIFLETQRDRIIPFVICNIWYFWIWYVWRNLPGIPVELVVLAMSIFIASAIGLMANIYMKISMHSIAMGVMLSFMILISFTQSSHPGIYLSVAAVITGMVCTARLIASDHVEKEIYGGLLAGFAALIVAILFTGR